jgi:FkbM family methyltransferase
MTLTELYRSYQANSLDKHDYIALMYTKHQALFEYHDYIKDTDISSITIENDRIFVTIKESGIKMLLDPYDSRFIPIEILNFKSFDPVERGLIFDLASESSTIFDIGANIGWYSLNFDKLDNVQNIYSFEPIPRTFDYLSQHVAMNECRKINLNNFALSNRNGETEFFCNIKETGSSSMKNIQDRPDSVKVTCQLRTMDDFTQSNNLTVDMIKCDVEGSELMVFQGGIKTLKRDKPYIFTEMLRKWAAKFNYHPNDIIALLNDLGYMCCAFEQGILTKIETVTEDTEATNFFFLHKEKHAAKIINLFGS